MRLFRLRTVSVMSRFPSRFRGRPASRERYLNADVEVRAAPNGDLSGIEISAKSPRGVQVPSRLLGMRYWGRPRCTPGRTPTSINTVASTTSRSFKIVGNKVVLESGRAPLTTAELFRGRKR